MADRWKEDNTLALVEAMQKHVRKTPGLEVALDGGLVEVALGIGMSEADIQDALASDRMLVIYEP
jgi:hypothetical protein